MNKTLNFEVACRWWDRGVEPVKYGGVVSQPVHFSLSQEQHSDATCKVNLPKTVVKKHVVAGVLVNSQRNDAHVLNIMWSQMNIYYLLDWQIMLGLLNYYYNESDL